MGEGVVAELDFFDRAGIVGTSFQRHFGVSIAGIVDNIWELPKGVCFIVNAMRQLHFLMLPSMNPPTSADILKHDVGRILVTCRTYRMHLRNAGMMVKEGGSTNVRNQCR
jgi:hypothetical protein